MRQKITEILQRTENFFQQGLWEINEEVLPGLRRIPPRLAKIVYMSVKGLADKEFLTLASSLTFSTTLSLVPILALSFAVAKGFGAQDRLEPILISRTLAGPAQEVIPKIVEYVNKTNVKPLGSIGLVILVFTALNVLGKIENCFNKVWGVTRSRTFFRRFSDYLSVLTIGPILMIGAVGLSTTLSSQTITKKLLEIGLFAGFMKIFILSLPWICIMLALTFLYIFIPNTRVRLYPALCAGIIAGALWQIVQFGYIHFQVGVARYNAIYGTFASVPIFLVWVYVSWVIVLAGAEISFACQNVRQFRGLALEKDVNYTTRERAALSVMLELCGEYATEESRLSAEEISGKLRLPLVLIKEILDQLFSMGYILPIEQDRELTFVPARPLEKIYIADFFHDFKRAGGAIEPFIGSGNHGKVDQVLTRRARSIDSEFQKENFKDLILNN